MKVKLSITGRVDSDGICPYCRSAYTRRGTHWFCKCDDDDRDYHHGQ